MSGSKAATGRAAKITGGFWKRRQQAVIEKGISHAYDQLNETGSLEALEIAAGTRKGPIRGYVFRDSDVYKWLEAASLAWAVQPSDDLKEKIDHVVNLIGAAQHPDGYINSSFSNENAPLRFRDLTRDHEIYCAGHLIQAAVAHRRSFGSEKLLGIALKFCELLNREFGPDGKVGACGHPEAEMALVELYRETGDRRWLSLARRFLDARGQSPRVLSGSEYVQDHLPVSEQREAVGHAVRCLYLFAGAADYVRETNAAQLLEAARAVWDDIYHGKAYITGGVGSRHDGESIGAQFELPNARAYAESCAAIAAVMFNQRMQNLDGDAKYAAMIERTVYNGMLSGISLNACRYFYVNPLESDGSHERKPWYDCACCPPNLYRAILSFSELLYSEMEDGIRINLFVDSEFAGNRFGVRVKTDWPWSGDVRIEPASSGNWSLSVRIPAWCWNAEIAVNGEPVAGGVSEGYSRIERDWRSGDVVTAKFPMSARFVRSHPLIRENQGCVTLMRGPMVYCIESADNEGRDVREFRVDARAPVEEVPMTICGEPVVGLRISGSYPVSRSRVPYEPAEIESTQREPAEAVAIPYFVWANRGANPMLVWMPTDERP
jgi:DUF1680 family protein